MKKIKINLLIVLMGINFAYLHSAAASPASYFAAGVSISAASAGLAIRASANCGAGQNSPRCRSTQPARRTNTSARRYACGSKPNGKYIWCKSNRKTRRRHRTRRNLPYPPY